MMSCADLKARIPLRRVARDLNIDLPADGVKFCSPFREDRHPSCTVKGEVMRDWSLNQTIDVIGFYSQATGSSVGDSIGRLAQNYGQNIATPFVNLDSRSVRSSTAPRKDFSFGWPRLERGCSEDFVALSQLRDIDGDTLREMDRRGLLRFADFRDGRAFVVTDSRRSNAQARLLCGEKWPYIDSATRSPRSDTGAVHGWPIGLAEAVLFTSIALTEGVPDFLSVLHHAAASGVTDRVAPVMLPGANVRIVSEALALFRGKRVRIFVHNDAGAGHKAYRNWAAQLEDAGATVDGFEFSNLVQSTGAVVKDLNDLCRLSVDSWEMNFDAIEVGMFNFVTEGER